MEAHSLSKEEMPKHKNVETGDNTNPTEIADFAESENSKNGADRDVSDKSMEVDRKATPPTQSPYLHLFPDFNSNSSSNNNNNN